MLYEITRLRQSGRNQTKRWFTCRTMDLFIWFHNSVPPRFQLAYNKRNKEKMIAWDTNRGFQHYLVDTGENNLHHYKQTPLLIDTNAHKNIRKLAHDFLTASVNLDTDISDFIFARLMELPANQGKHSAVRTDQTFPG